MRRPCRVAGSLLLLCLLSPPALHSQQAVAVRDAFRAYVYYEDRPVSSDGLAVPLTLSGAQIDYLRERADPGAPEGFTLLAREDSAHWMGLQLLEDRWLLRIRDASNEYNCRLAVDLRTGALRVLRGVDYTSFDESEDAAFAAYLAAGYLDRLMAGAAVFVRDLAVPAGRLPVGSPDAVGVPPPQTAAEAVMVAEIPPGYLRIHSTASIAASELFAADLFGADNRLEDGDIEQAEIWTVTASGSLDRMPPEEIADLVSTSRRGTEGVPDVKEIAGIFEEMAAERGGFDLILHSMQMILSVAPLPPADSGQSSSGEAETVQGAPREVFELLQRLGSSSGLPESGPEGDEPITVEDLELLAWIRLQRSASTTQGYPPLVESGGTLSWGDFAVLATAKLAEAGVPSMVLMIRRPEGSSGVSTPAYHAMCVYRTQAGWSWMDAGRMGEEVDPYWDRLPALVYRQDVRFRIVDVQAEWLRHVPRETSGWLISRLVS